MKRYALVRNARTRQEAEAYLPDNYRVIHELGPSIARWDTRLSRGPMFVIEGEDKAGWTLDDYVIPRYASGIIACEEIDLSHPLMKEVAQ